MKKINSLFGVTILTVMAISTLVGVQLKGDLVYFGIKTHENIQQIYSIPKNAY